MFNILTRKVLMPAKPAVNTETTTSLIHNSVTTLAVVVPLDLLHVYQSGYKSDPNSVQIKLYNMSQLTSQKCWFTGSELIETKLLV